MRKILKEEANMNSRILLVIVGLCCVFLAIGAELGRLRVYKDLSVNIERSMQGEQIVQVSTTVKFKDGALVEIAPFKEIK